MPLSRSRRVTPMFQRRTRAALAQLSIAFAVLAALASSCNPPSEVHRYEGPLTLETRNPELRMTNTTQSTIYYFIVERDLATLIDWAPCADPATCRGVAAKANKSLKYSEIAGWEKGKTEAIIWWWHLTPNAAGRHTPTAMGNRVITL
jgi:hypothetical protein